MERFIIAALLLLICGCTGAEKTNEHKISINDSDLENEVIVTESLEIPKDLDSMVAELLPNSSTFWIKEESVLTTWPIDLKDAIETTICMDDANTTDCKPGDFNVVNLNDSLDMVIDYSPMRSGSAGTPYYIFNRKSKHFISKHLGTVYGIVKSKNFIGFIFMFRYSGENGVYQFYESLEQVTSKGVQTYAILTPNDFNSIEEQRKDFESNKKHFFSDLAK